MARASPAATAEKAMLESVRRTLWRGAVLLSAACAFVPAAHAPIPCDQGGFKMAMWKAIADHCIDHPGPNTPKDCVVVDDRIVIARDSFKPEAFLVVARDPVCGIEDDQVRAPGTPNYWLAGWTNRKLVGDGWTVGLAINARDRRSQNRLHIHVDRLCMNVARALSAPGSASRPFADPLLKPWHALPIAVSDIAAKNIFALVAAAEPEIPPAEQSIALVAAKNDPTKALVLYGADRDGAGHAEDLFSYGGRCGG